MNVFAARAAELAEVRRPQDTLSSTNRLSARATNPIRASSLLSVVATDCSPTCSLSDDGLALDSLARLEQRFYRGSELWPASGCSTARHGGSE
jgi:hypothetical protein